MMNQSANENAQPRHVTNNERHHKDRNNSNYNNRNYYNNRRHQQSHSSNAINPNDELNNFNDNYEYRNNFDKHRDKSFNQGSPKNFDNEQLDSNYEYGHSSRYSDQQNHRQNSGFANNGHSNVHKHHSDLPPRFSKMKNANNNRENREYRNYDLSQDMNQLSFNNPHRHMPRNYSNENSSHRSDHFRNFNDYRRQRQQNSRFNEFDRRGHQHHPPSDVVDSSASTQEQSTNKPNNGNESKRQNDKRFFNSKNSQDASNLADESNQSASNNSDSHFRDHRQPPKTTNRNNFSRFNNRAPNKSSFPRFIKKDDDGKESQREIMDKLLRKAEYECIVCCDSIKISHKTWNCPNCFNVFHLKCIQPWAKTSAVKEESNGSDSNNRSRNKNKEWRCPTCQSVQQTFPHNYFCFCGKVRDPEMNNYCVPHSCGDTCSRQLSLFTFNNEDDDDDVDYFTCLHRCTLQCHPGKCAPCNLKVERSCACSKTKMIMNCVSKKVELICKEICGKLKNCGTHYCQRNCHYGSCDTCEKVLDVRCFCGKETETGAACGKQKESFSCGKKCSKSLSCTFHACLDLCHPGECGSCPFDPQTVKCCPCGKTLLANMTNKKARQLCIDPIPVCDQVCNKQLSCGNENDPHYCKNSCHTGPCSPCSLSTIIKCECGANSQKILCTEMTSPKFQCKKKCGKKLKCGRHKCLNTCCTDKEHLCLQTCGRKLDCGKHNCEEPCHSFCRACSNLIWTEIHCNCGAQVLYPPLPCNTTRPPCDQPCNRSHDCDHTPKHPCHDESQCPPCTEFVEKVCYCGNEVCSNVMCFKKGVSCGKFCMKKLSCNLHNCQKVCHENSCPTCVQKCTKPRTECEHACGLACHQASSETCPRSLCKEIVKVYCDCEVKVETRECHEVSGVGKLQTAIDCMARRYCFNTTIELNEIHEMAKYSLYHILECDEKCSREKRLKDLAEAFGDLDEKSATWVKYTDFLKSKAQTNQQFMLTVHDKLVELVNDFKKSNLKTLSYSFPSMNRDNRTIIHSYAEYFSMKTKSIDQEPNRSVIVIADITSFIPRVNIFDAINVDINTIRPKPNFVKYKRASEENKDKKVIDYFDFED